MSTPVPVWQSGPPPSTDGQRLARERWPVPTLSIPSSAYRFPSSHPFPGFCHGCYRRIGQQWLQYEARVAAREEPHSVLTSLGVTRPCCRTAFLMHEEMPSFKAPRQR